MEILGEGSRFHDESISLEASVSPWEYMPVAQTVAMASGCGVGRAVPAGFAPGAGIPVRSDPTQLECSPPPPQRVGGNAQSFSREVRSRAGGPALSQPLRTAQGQHASPLHGAGTGPRFSGGGQWGAAVMLGSCEVMRCSKWLYLLDSTAKGGSGTGQEASAKTAV